MSEATDIGLIPEEEVLLDYVKAELVDAVVKVLTDVANRNSIKDINVMDKDEVVNINTAFVIRATPLLTKYLVSIGEDVLESLFNVQQ